MFDLKDRKFLVTGSTGGIGKAIVSLLHSLGATIFATGSNRDKLDALASEFSERLFVEECDLSDLEGLGDNGWQNLPKKADKVMNGFDGIICNAGITKDMLFLRMNMDDWRKVMHINLDVTFALNKEAAKIMMKRRKGRIVNISSVVASKGNVGQSNYVASKAGMVGLTKTLARELAARNVTANCVSPGFIETPMTDVLSGEIKDIILSEIPLKRIGEPDDIAAAVAYLLSDGAKYVTGTNLHVNGGLLME